MPTDQTAEALSPYGESSRLEMLHDRSTGQYYTLGLASEQYGKPILKELGVDEKCTKQEMKVAIVDSGLMLNHPWIKRRILKSVDFTGEGVEDLVGHGTWVSLIFIATAPLTYRLLNVKVINRFLRASEENIIKGIEWSVKEGADVINLSVGIPREKHGMPECKGDCALCRAAEEAANQGCLVIAAAGNDPGKTCCPAKVGLLGRKVISVGAYVPETGQIASYSGIGNTYCPELRYRLIPVNDLTSSSDIETCLMWFDKGISLEKAGKHREALSAFEKAVELNPAYSVPLFNKGVVLEHLGKDEEAVSSYNEAMKLAPTDVNVPYNRGVVLVRLGRYEEALCAFDDALKVDRCHALTWNNKGAVLDKLGREDEALLAFEKATELDPKDARAWTNKGFALKNLGKYAQALSAFERCVEINPNDAHAWNQKGLLLVRLGRNREAPVLFEL